MQKNTEFVFPIFWPLDAGIGTLWPEHRILREISSLDPDSQVWNRKSSLKKCQNYFPNNFVLNQFMGLLASNDSHPSTFNQNPCENANNATSWISIGLLHVRQQMYLKWHFKHFEIQKPDGLQQNRRLLLNMLHIHWESLCEKGKTLKRPLRVMPKTCKRSNFGNTKTKTPFATKHPKPRDSWTFLGSLALRQGGSII